MESVSVTPNKKYLEGPVVQINEEYGGLGALFLDTLFENLNKIHQIDTVTGVTESNGSVRARAIQCAHELLHCGLTENDIVLICSRGHADQTVVVLACLLIGVIVAPIDSDFYHKECVELVGQLKPKICFCDLRSLKQMERIVGETGITSLMVLFGEQQQNAVSFRKFTMNRAHSSQFNPVHIEYPRKHCAFILATQGVTGPPRLVCLSHHFIYCQISILLDSMNSPKKVLSYYPLSWVTQVILMCLCFKEPVVRVLTGLFVERTACKLIHDLKVDHIFLNTELALQLAEHVAVKVYCTTEVGIVISSTPDDYVECQDRIGTVGKAVQNCKIRVVDIDTRKDVEAETSGELLVAGHCMMLGYFKNMNYTKMCTQEGYFKTGDIARYDSFGWIFIEGRIADLIKVEGFKESPRELEDTIMMHPFVKDTAVIGNDREVVACIVPKTDTKLDENKILTFVSEKLPVNKWPTRVVFMTDFPTTPLGKIRRDVLKQEILGIRIEQSHTHVLG